MMRSKSGCLRIWGGHEWFKPSTRMCSIMSEDAVLIIRAQIQKQEASTGVSGGQKKRSTTPRHTQFKSLLTAHMFWREAPQVKASS